ncbi:hypothetical protein [Chitiniphilus eburneus]|uniref:Uncharacterized protein n=1 Tax=Chitiniphilus eburneus TaxID=2571148 RepID=A0A4U0PFG2_9NEIS|nr:hypothetical protein [Chitiniphilus eburneus]TJZ66390.1 hypothetical protein FAZ21_17350 [Chitiniphilus eburneus]
MSSLLGNTIFRLFLRSQDIDGYLQANIATRLSDLIGIPLSIVFLLMVKGIYAMQMVSFNKFLA